MKKVLLSVGMFLFPVFAFAEDITNTQSSIEDTMASLTAIVNSVIPFLLAIAVVIFIWGVIKYVVSPGPEEKAAARGYIIYGIIGIVVILSIFGLVRLVQSMFGLEGGATLSPDEIPTVSY